MARHGSAMAIIHVQRIKVQLTENHDFTVAKHAGDCELAALSVSLLSMHAPVAFVMYRC